MNFKYEYKDKIELAECNIFLYSDAKYLIEYLPSHIIQSIPKDDQCAVYHDFKTTSIFVKLDNEPEKNRRLGSKTWSKIVSSKSKKIHLIGVESIPFWEGLLLSTYKFDVLKTKKEDSTITFVLDERQKKEFHRTAKTCHSVFWTRDLVNLPFNYLDSETYIQAIQKRFQDTEIELNILNKEQLKKQNFGGLLSVNQASVKEPSFVIAEYKSSETKQEKPIVLIGKGVVYDTGGLSIKPTEHSMDFMKCDMAGSASVLGTLDAIEKLKLNVWVIVLCPITDNHISNKAFAPGDVITMRNQMTVEVMDTDAEGRLILADALDYAKSLNPLLVIDMATLTGAAVRAIGDQAAVIMGTASSHNFHLISRVGDEVGERVARFPFWDDYKDQLKSEIADIKNLGGPTAGAITAGKFLEYFVDYPWIHIDIAGPAYTHKSVHYQGVGGTGFGVRLLLEFINRLLAEIKENNQ